MAAPGTPDAPSAASRNRARAVAGGHQSFRQSQPRPARSAALPDRPPGRQSPGAARQSHLPHARAHRRRERRLFHRRPQQPARRVRQRPARHAREALRLRPHRLRIPGFLPAGPHVRGGRDPPLHGAARDSAHFARAAGNLSKLRSLVEVARALQSSLSTGDVLAAVVDAALAVTGAERGFLLLANAEQLEVSVARDRRGAPLASTDLKVPRSLILRALRTRRELLSMTFDPAGGRASGNVGGRSRAAQRGLRSADSRADRFAAGHAGLIGPRRRGRAVHGLAPQRGRSFGRQPRDPADARARSLHHPRKRASACGRAREAAPRRRAEHRPLHPARPAPQRAPHRWLVPRRRLEHFLAPGGRRLFRRAPDRRRHLRLRDRRRLRQRHERRTAGRACCKARFCSPPKARY